MRKGQSLAERFRGWVEALEDGVVRLSAILLIVWLVPPAQEWLKGLRLLSTDTIVAIIGLALVLVFRTVRDLEQTLDRSKLDQNRSVVPLGVANVYERLAEICLKYSGRSSRNRRSLEVLGLTLFTAWPRVRGFFEDCNFSGWDVRLLCIDPHFARTHCAVIPEKWAQEAENRIKEIRTYAEDHGHELRLRNVTLTLMTYSSFPAMHGFRIESNEILCSTVHWNGTQLDDPYQFYEHFLDTDRSLCADLHRKLFGNWIERATSIGEVKVRI